MLTAAGLRLRWHPQQKTASLLGQAQPSVAPAPAPASASAYAEALPIGRAVERVAAVLPWHPVCLPRAVAVAWMLRRRGIDCRAHLGVTATAAKEAHAWVTVGGVVVQGAPIDDITELASFV
jgi:hypothetical protein